MRHIAVIISIIFSAEAGAYACATSDLIASKAFLDSGGVILSRPEMQYKWATPDGIFFIHYDIDGPMAVYHPNEDVNPPDGIPDYVNRCAEFLHISHDVIINGLGFDPPPQDGDQGGDSKYDIYLTNVPALTTPESPSDEYPGRPAYSSYIQLGHDMRIPRYPDNPYPFLQVSAAHEYFHAVEFAYRAYSADVTPWWFESCAVWIEEVVFDDVNDGYYQLPDYLHSLHKSLYLTSGAFLYGAWLYPEFLNEVYGPSLIKECWEKFAAFDFAVDAVDLAFDDFGIDFNTEYCHHIIWNYFTDYNYRPGFYEEGNMFGQTVIVASTHSEYPVPWTEQPVEQQNLSGTYIEFLRPQISRGSLVLEYHNPTNDQQYLGIAIMFSDGQVEYEIHKIDNMITPAFYIPDFANCDKVIMTPVWGYEGYIDDSTTLYSYRAYIDSASTSVVANDDRLPRFELTGAYPNPFNGSVSFSFISPVEEYFKIMIYDTVGRLVMTESGASVRGLNSVRLDFPDYLAGGVFFYSIQAEKRSLDGKILYLK